MFNVGDEVVFKDSLKDMTFGKTYEIKESTKEYVLVIDDNGDRHYIKPFRFDHVKPFEFQSGDVVEFGGLIGTVYNSELPETSYPLSVKFEDESVQLFTKDGKWRDVHTKPLLNLVSRPKKKEKRVVKVKVAYNPSSNETYIPEIGSYPKEGSIVVELEKEIEVEV